MAKTGASKSLASKAPAGDEDQKARMRQQSELLIEAQNATVEEFFKLTSDPRFKYMQGTLLSLAAGGKVENSQALPFAKKYSEGKSVQELREAHAQLVLDQPASAWPLVVYGLRVGILHALFEAGDTQAVIDCLNDPLPPFALRELLGLHFPVSQPIGPAFMGLFQAHAARIDAPEWHAVFLAHVDNDSALVDALWAQTWPHLKGRARLVPEFLGVLVHGLATSTIARVLPELEALGLEGAQCKSIVASALQHRNRDTGLSPLANPLRVRLTVATEAARLVYAHWNQRMLADHGVKGTRELVREWFDSMMENVSTYDPALTALLAPECTVSQLKDTATRLEAQIAANANNPRHDAEPHLAVIQELVMQRALDAHSSDANQEVARERGGL